MRNLACASSRTKSIFLLAVMSTHHVKCKNALLDHVLFQPKAKDYDVQPSRTFIRDTSWTVIIDRSLSHPG